MKIAICGVGNRLRGDDGIGPMVIEELSREDINKKNVLLLDCQSVPESFIFKIEEFKPKKVIIIDAVELGKEPGTIEEVDINRIKGQLMSTHKLPVSLFIDYLQKKLEDYRIVFIGVQPENTGFGSRMSRECREAVGKAKDMVLEMI